jgi:hypothetical protein
MKKGKIMGESHFNFNCYYILSCSTIKRLETEDLKLKDVEWVYAEVLHVGDVIAIIKDHWPKVVCIESHTTSKDSVIGELKMRVCNLYDLFRVSNDGYKDC